MAGKTCIIVMKRNIFEPIHKNKKKRKLRKKDLFYRSGVFSIKNGTRQQKNGCKRQMYATHPYWEGRRVGNPGRSAVTGILAAVNRENFRIEVSERSRKHGSENLMLPHNGGGCAIAASQNAVSTTQRNLSYMQCFESGFIDSGSGFIDSGSGSSIFGWIPIWIQSFNDQNIWKIYSWKN